MDVMSDNEEKRKIDRTQQEHFDALEKIKTEKERKSYLASLVSQIMEDEFKKTAPKQGDALDAKYNFSNKPKVSNTAKDLLIGAMFNQLVESLESKAKKLNELQLHTHHSAVQKREIEQLNKEIDAKIADYVRHAKDTVLAGGDKTGFFKKEVNEKIKNLVLAHGQVLQQAPLIQPKSPQPVVLSKAPTVQASKKPTEEETRVMQLISKYQGHISEIYSQESIKKEKKIHISGVLNSFRNAVQNKKNNRGDQIKEMEQALLAAKNIMNSNTPEKSTEALKIIEKAAIELNQGIKHENPIIKSRLRNISKEILNGVESVKGTKVEQKKSARHG